MLIQTGDLAKTYNMGPTDVHALRGVTLAVEHGEFVAIMGASGSGKSTLLHLLGCLDRPSHGWYFLDGMEVESLDDGGLSRLRNRRIGFVFQTFNLIAQHNILENVELPMVYAGWDRRIRRERSFMLLSQVGLGDKPHHRPTELSGGQIQRVAIARALAVDPLLLLADEPTGNLDSETGEAIMRLFVELNERGATVIVVTHSRDVASHAKRMIEMRDGLVVRDLRGISPFAAQSV